MVSGTGLDRGLADRDRPVQIRQRARALEPTPPRRSRIFSSDVFPIEEIELNQTTESIVRGSRSPFSRFGAAFDSVQRVAVLGWGPRPRPGAQSS